jgi:hypothetical protein
MKLLTAGGLSYKRARIVTGVRLAPSYLSAGVLWRRLGTRGLLERAPRLWLSGGESWSSMFGSIMPWANDRLGAGSPRSTSCCLQTVLSPSGSTSGGNAMRRRVAGKRWSERTGSSVLELPLLRGVLELLLLRLDKSFLGREQFMEDESASSRLGRNAVGLGRHRGLH